MNWNPLSWGTEAIKEGVSLLPGAAPYDARNPNSPFYSQKKTVQIPGRAITPGEANQPAPQPMPPVLGADKAFAPTGNGGGSYGSGGAQAAQDGKDAAERDRLRGDIRGRGIDLNSVYEALFGSLDNLLRDRATQVEGDYGGQFATAAKQYSDSLPAIENSYAAIGADSSTDNTYAKSKAKEGYETTNKQIQKNKEGDLTKIGNYGAEQRSRWNADKESSNRLVSRVDDTEDLGDLRASRNAIEDKLGSVKADQGTLQTDSGARGELSKLTGDAGRFDSLTTALDSIIKGSMSGAVKDAAVKSVIDSGGLTDEDKRKVQAMYGNTYADQAAL